MLDVMDDMQHEGRAAQDATTTTSGEAREETRTVLATGRLLANPRRVRRA
jgi:hypothetical protein